MLRKTATALAVTGALTMAAGSEALAQKANPCGAKNPCAVESGNPCAAKK